MFSFGLAQLHISASLSLHYINFLITPFTNKDKGKKVKEASQHDLCQKHEVMMRMLVDLAPRVQVTEDQQREVEASPTASTSTSHPDRRGAARCQLPLTASPATSRPSRKRAARSQPSPTQELALSMAGRREWPSG